MANHLHQSFLDFTFVTPPRLIVGWSAATDGRLAIEAKRFGKRPLLFSGKTLRDNGTLALILASFQSSGIPATTYEGIPPEPTVRDLQDAMEGVRKSGADMVIAIGGGSVLDIAKAAAALAQTESLTAADYFAARASVPDSGGLPIIAVPTTSGTGSEATWVSVLVDDSGEGQPRKASIRGGAMMPVMALLDAQLTVTCPPTVTAYSGMDAFVQAVEAFTSKGANPFTDALAFEAALLTANNLRTAFAEPSNQSVREAMILGSYMAGVALNTSRLGLVHGLAHPIGAITGATHGLLCGLLMPAVMRFNQDAARKKYERLATTLGIPDGSEGLIAFTERLLRDIKIPTHLSEIGLKEEDIAYIARESLPSGSTKANPRPVSEADAYSVTMDCF